MTTTHTELSRCPLPNATRADITITIWEHDGEGGHRHGIEIAHAACGWSASYTPDYPLTALNVLSEVENHLPLVDVGAIRGEAYRAGGEAAAKAIENADTSGWPGGRGSDVDGCQERAAEVARTATR